jgi:D-glycero-D-manno-heptose 1,7-bisphosphate phosphatase
MKRAVFLDRDNTLIANDGDLGDPEAVQLIKAAALGVAALRGLGYQIAVVTNQGGVARGKYSEDDVNAVHDRINEHLHAQANGAKIDRFYFCPFHPDGSVTRYRKEHPWRKPAPGMLLQAAEDMKLDLSLCWMIGDAPRDIEAGKAAGVRTIQITGGKSGQSDLPLDPNQRPDFTASNLIEAARIVAQQIRPEAASLGDSSSEQADQPKPANPPSPRGTFPAKEQLGTTKHSGRKGGPVNRPFKPWSIQPVSNGDVDAAEPVASTLRMTQPTSETPSEPTPPTPPPPPPSIKMPTPPEPVEPIQPAAPDEPAEPETATRTDHLLTQILREMKNARAHDADWSAMKTAAIGVVQPLAAFCGLMALLNVDQPGTLMSWLLGAVFGQLLVLTLLVLHWQK